MTTTERRVGRPRVHRDDTLLDAARGAFARDGFQAASMDTIAAAAGTTKPTLYARFGSKEALYERTVERDADALLEQLFDAYSSVVDLPVREMVAPAMRAYFDYFAATPDAFPLLFAPDRSDTSRAIAERVHDAMTVRIAALVERVLGRSGRDAPETARMMAAMLVGIAHHAAREVRRDQSLGYDRACLLATDFASAALHGLDPQLVEPG
jgi:AcrR family transcriptional regulator